MRTNILALAGFIFSSTFGSLECVAQVAASAARSCSVAGQVTGMLTGVSVRNAMVWLRPVNTDADTLAAARMSTLGYGASVSEGQYSTTSNEDGSFCFENVKPGLYTMVGTKTGFLDTSFGAVSPTESGKAITVQSEPLTNLNLALINQGVVAGKVTDEYDEPVSGASVSLLMRMSIGGQTRNVPVRGAQSNDLGEFRVANVAPGTYYLVVEPKAADRRPGASARSPLRTFYPSAASAAQATPIIVGAGEARLGLSVRLLSGQTHSVRGMVVGLLPTDQGAIQMHPEDEQQVFIAIGGANYKPDGSFEFANVAPGAYVLSYFQVSGDSAKSARRVVTVGDRDVNDVVLSIANSVAIAGRIRVEGTGSGDAVDFSKLRVNLSSSEALVGPSVNATMGTDGGFVIQNIIPGRYRLRTDPPPESYLKAVRYGQQEVKNLELSVTEGSSDILEIVYRYGLASVSGRVEDPRGGSVPAWVVLAPAETSSGSTELVVGASDGTGTFVLPNVPPGHYRIHAFESVDLAALDVPEVRRTLSSGGTDIEVAEGEQKALAIPLSSAEDLRRLIGAPRGQ